MYTGSNFYSFLVDMQSSSSFNLSQETPDVSQLFDTPVLPKQEHKSDVDDLFSAHDFDIHIDLPSGPEV